MKLPNVKNMFNKYSDVAVEAALVTGVALVSAGMVMGRMLANAGHAISQGKSPAAHEQAVMNMAESGIDPVNIAQAGTVFAIAAAVCFVGKKAADAAPNVIEKGRSISRRLGL